VSSGLLILLPSVVNKQIACPFRTLMQPQDRALLQPVFAMLNMSLVAVEIGCARIDTARRRAKWCGIASVVAIRPTPAPPDSTGSHASYISPNPPESIDVAQF
jgi:hypothetical protein